MGLLPPYHPPTIFTIPPPIFTIPLTTFTIPFIIDEASIARSSTKSVQLPPVWSLEVFPADSPCSRHLFRPRSQHQAWICLLSSCSVPPAGRDLPSGTPEPWPPSQGRLLRKAAVQSGTLYVFVSGVGLGLRPASGEVGASILCPADLRLQGFCGCQESPPHLLDCTMSLPWCLRVLLVHRPLSLLFAMHPEEHTIPGWEPAWSRGLCTKTTEPDLILQPP